MRNNIRQVGALVLSFQLACAGFAWAGDLSGLARVTPGMTKDAALAILGSPDSILDTKTDADGKVHETLAYEVVKELPTSPAEGAGQSLWGFTSAVLTLGASESYKARTKDYEAAMKRQTLDSERYYNPPYLLVFENGVLQKVERAVMVPKYPASVK
jgi:hypothetical protein